MTLPLRRKQTSRLARHRVNQSAVSPLQVHQIVHGGTEIPDPIEFVVSDKYLNRPNLYPRQGTLLKIIFLRDDLFSSYDLDVIAEWEQTFARTGNEGINPGIHDRIRICKAQGRPWFREVLTVIGRRGSKGHLGALCGAYVLWHYMHRPGGPQAYYGIDRDKRLVAIVFAGKKEQAVANQWRDINHVITGAPCFRPYISVPQKERLTVFAPSDLLKVQRQEMYGLVTEDDLATFEILPSSSTLMAGRGPTSFMQFYDEWAHVVATGANRNADDVYQAASPSLDQFGVDAFVYQGSSPWQMMGQFYENWQKAIEMDAGQPVYPEMLMVQLPSWAIYRDWEEATHIPLIPPQRVSMQVETYESEPGQVEPVLRTRTIEQVVPGPSYAPLKRAIQTYDDQMRQLQRANPETFAVERQAHWAAVLGAYLDKQKVSDIFGEWHGAPLLGKERGILDITYVAHGDPSKSNAGFGWAMGHREWDEALGLHHVVIDVIHSWRPENWDDHKVAYLEVEEDIEDYITRFVPETVTFDQYNSIGTIARLQRFIAGARLHRDIAVYEKTASRNYNWRRSEVGKTAINLGLVHAPMYNSDGSVNPHAELAELEMRFLQEKNGAVDHPTTGPVQTKDIADCIFEIIYVLLAEEMAPYLGQALSDIGISGSVAGGIGPRVSDVTDAMGDALTSVSREGGGGRGRGMGAPSRTPRGMRQR